MEALSTNLTYLTSSLPEVHHLDLVISGRQRSTEVARQVLPGAHGQQVHITAQVQTCHLEPTTDHPQLTTPHLASHHQLVHWLTAAAPVVPQSHLLVKMATDDHLGAG